MEARDIILKPLITEKSVAKMSEGKYAFKVRLDANKTQIKQAIEEIFGVTVVRVNTMRDARQAAPPGQVHRAPFRLEEGHRPAQGRRQHQGLRGPVRRVHDGNQAL